MNQDEALNCVKFLFLCPSDAHVCLQVTLTFRAVVQVSIACAGAGKMVCPGNCGMFRKAGAPTAGGGTGDVSLN